MTRPIQTCASCARFPLADAARAGGIAQCGGYERPATWSDASCVLYNKASDREARKGLVRQLMEAERQKGTE